MLSRCPAPRFETQFHAFIPINPSRRLPGHRSVLSSSDSAPAAAGPYSHAIRVTGELLFISGQIALDAASGELVGNTPADQARKCLENLQTIASDAGSSLEDAVKVTVYLTDISAFDAVNGVYPSFLPEKRGGQRRGARGGSAAQGSSRRSRSTPWWPLAPETRVLKPRNRRAEHQGGARAGGGGRRARDADHHHPHALRACGYTHRAEGGEPPGHRLIQAARSDVEALGAGGEERTRRRLRERRKPRPGGRLCRALARRALRGVHAGGRTDREGRGCAGARSHPAPGGPLGR